MTFKLTLTRSTPTSSSVVIFLYFWKSGSRIWVPFKNTIWHWNDLHLGPDIKLWLENFQSFRWRLENNRSLIKKQIWPAYICVHTRYLSVRCGVFYSVCPLSCQKKNNNKRNDSLVAIEWNYSSTSLAKKKQIQKNWVKTLLININQSLNKIIQWSDKN